MKPKKERLKRLCAYGMSPEDLIRCVLSADPKPLWEQEKEERRAKEEEKAKKKNTCST